MSKAQNKFDQVMREWEKGTLRDSHGSLIKYPREHQRSLAAAFGEARRIDPKFKMDQKDKKQDGGKTDDVFSILDEDEIKELKDIITGEKKLDFGGQLYDKLFEYYAFTTNEMPYGTIKARTGDPYNWIVEKIQSVKMEHGGKTDLWYQAEYYDNQGGHGSLAGSSSDFEKEYHKALDLYRREKKSGELNKSTGYIGVSGSGDKFAILFVDQKYVNNMNKSDFKDENFYSAWMNAANEVLKTGKPVKSEYKVIAEMEHGGSMPDRGRIPKDLLGERKMTHQMLLDEYLKEIKRTYGKDAVGGARETFVKHYNEAIQNAINKNWYQEDIEKGRMTASDAKTIIESAGIKVPNNILAKGDYIFNREGKKVKVYIPTKEDDAYMENGGISDKHKELLKNLDPNFYRVTPDGKILRVGDPIQIKEGAEGEMHFDKKSVIIRTGYYISSLNPNDESTAGETVAFKRKSDGEKFQIGDTASFKNEKWKIKSIDIDQSGEDDAPLHIIDNNNFLHIIYDRDLEKIKKENGGSTDKIKAYFAYQGDFNDIYKDDTGKKYADVDGVLYYITDSDYEEPISPARNVEKAENPKYNIGDLVNYPPLKLKNLKIESRRYSNGSGFGEKAGWYYNFKNSNLSSHEDNLIKRGSAMKDGGKMDDELLEMIIKYHGNKGDNEKLFRQIGSGKNALKILLGNFARQDALDKLNPELVKYIKTNNMSIVNDYVQQFRDTKNTIFIKAADDIENFFKSKIGESIPEIVTDEIRSDYTTRDPEIIWNEWSPKQRGHFLNDHRAIGFTGKKYSELPLNTKIELSDHIKDGRYKDGGKSKSIKKKIKTSVIKSKINDDNIDWIDDYAEIATKKQLKEQRRELIKNKNDVENYKYKLNKLNRYIALKK